MRGFIRYQFISYIRSLKLIPPVTVFGAWVFILYAYKYVPILSSYAVTSIAMYLIMTWVAMGIFSIEEENEKHILFVQLGSKSLFLWGKWVICLAVAFLLGVFAIVYPVAMDNFKGAFCQVHLWLALYSHFCLAILGILVGTFFSITSFASRKYAWLAAVLVIVISLAYEGLAEKTAWLKWPLIVFPPVDHVLKYLSGGDSIHIGSDFWLNALLVLAYSLIFTWIVKKMFLRKEQ